MTVFNRAMFIALTVRRKGPSEQRRLKRRLEERHRRRQGLPLSAPHTIAPPTIRSPEEKKTIRATRRTKRFRRRIRQRQLMALRSGIPELVRRVPASLRAQEEARCQAQRAPGAKAAGAASVNGVRPSQGETMGPPKKQANSLLAVGGEPLRSIEDAS